MNCHVCGKDLKGDGVDDGYGELVHIRCQSYPNYREEKKLTLHEQATVRTRGVRRWARMRWYYLKRLFGWRSQMEKWFDGQKLRPDRLIMNKETYEDFLRWGEDDAGRHQQAHGQDQEGPR